MIESTMNGQPYKAGRFAATLRRHLYKGGQDLARASGPCAHTHAPEHLGLAPPQLCTGEEEVTAAMRPAPIPHVDETDEKTDRIVADPLSKQMDLMIIEVARKNREIFSEIFRPIPTNLVRKWTDYDVSEMGSLFGLLCLRL